MACIDGPDVIKGELGNDILIEACWSKVFIEHKDSWGQFTEDTPFLASILTGSYCAHELMIPQKMYITDAVDYCRISIVNIQATNYIEFISQLLIITEKVCNLHPVSFWNFKEPFQGEILDLKPSKKEGPNKKTKDKNLQLCAFLIANGFDVNSGLWSLQCIR